ncbi:MAG: hypothetical protein ACRDD8_12985 [Bacteroidales bacterium]
MRVYLKQVMAIKEKNNEIIYKFLEDYITSQETSFKKMNTIREILGLKGVISMKKYQNHIFIYECPIEPDGEARKASKDEAGYYIEIEDTTIPLNCKVKCIESYDDYFFAGDTYDVIEGYIYDCEKDKRGFSTCNSIEELEYYGLFELIEEVQEKYEIPKIGETIVITRDRWVFKKGEEFKVASVGKTHIFALSDETIIALELEDMKDFQIKRIEKWSGWSFINGSYCRTKGRTIEVMMSGEKGRAKCSPFDEFDIEKGINIASARAMAKFYKKKYERNLEIVKELSGK